MVYVLLVLVLLLLLLLLLDNMLACMFLSCSC
jgi:hypothetical protein